MLNKDITIYSNDYYKYIDYFETNILSENKFKITMNNNFVLDTDFKFVTVDSTITIINKDNIKRKLNKDYRKDLVNIFIAEPLKKTAEEITFNDIKLIRILKY